MSPTAIWLDDLRDPSEPHWAAWIANTGTRVERVRWVKSYDAFVEAFPGEQQHGQLVAVFFDNDLGEGREGRHAFTWMEEKVRMETLPEFGLFAQTANPAARQELLAGFESLRRFWRR